MHESEIGEASQAARARGSWGGTRKGAGRPRIFKGPVTEKHIQLDGTDLARLAQIREASPKILASDAGTVRWLITYAWLNLEEKGPKEVNKHLGVTPRQEQKA